MAHDRINVTPHLGASTAEAQEKAGVAVAQSVRKALAGELVPDAVNVAGGAIDPQVRPGIALTERLGRVVSAMACDPVTHLRVEVRGEVTQKDVSVLKLSALKGLFLDVVDGAVSYVNAPLFAQERGVTVELATEPLSENFRNVVTLVAATSAGQQIRVAGTVTGPKDVQKLTEIDGYDLEMKLSDHLVVFKYDDRPGVIGLFGQALGNLGINIEAMQVSPKNDQALAVLAVDSAVTAEVVDTVASEIGVSFARVANIEED